MSNTYIIEDIHTRYTDYIKDMSGLFAQVFTTIFLECPSVESITFGTLSKAGLYSIEVEYISDITGCLFYETDEISTGNSEDIRLSFSLSRQLLTDIGAYICISVFGGNSIVTINRIGTIIVE